MRGRCFSIPTLVEPFGSSYLGRAAVHADALLVTYGRRRDLPLDQTLAGRTGELLWVAAPHGSLGVLSEAAAFSFRSGPPPCSTSALLASRRQMSGPTTDDGGPWSFDSLMNSSDEEDDPDMPDNNMTVITIEYALFAADSAASGEPDAETAAEIDKLFKANSVLGSIKSDNCIALAKQVGVQPNRLYTEFKKRRAASSS